MMSNGREELLQVLADARRLLALPDNDFAWSSWSDADDAVSEIDWLIAALHRGELPKQTLRVLFTVAGPIQETSLSSGWAHAFLALAERFDTALERLERE